MQAEPQPFDPRTDAQGAEETTCPSCRALMPGQMRFCRLCGYRLGEGVAEYAETMRFQTPPSTTGRTHAQTAQAQPQSTNGSLKDWQAFAHNAQAQPTRQPAARGCRSRKGRGFPHWIIWPIIGIALSTGLTGGLMKPFARTYTVREIRIAPVLSEPPAPPAPPAIADEEEGSNLGADNFEETKEGLLLERVTPPNSAAEKAGLVGGDTLVSFDGQPVKDVDGLEELLNHTPVGKTVEVVYLRDGETRTTKLTTISEEENDRLEELADERPEGEGFIGEGTELERVAVPGTKIYGVRLDELRPNNPADIAGLRNGDIVIQFNDIPIRTRLELESRITRALPGTTARITVVRGNDRLELPVKIGKDD